MMATLVLAMALAAASPQGAQPSGVDIKPIDAGSMSGVGTARQAVARTDEEWAALWKQHAPSGKPAPKVDFSTRMVAAVFLGSRPTGGYRVSITGTRLEGNTLVVEWTEGAPGPRDITAQVMTSPAYLAEIPKHAGDVRFEKRKP